MKRTFAAITIGLAMLCITSLAQASLTTIGTAGYDSDGNGAIQTDENYNLIWNDNNNGNSVVWLDYRQPVATWESQNAWVSNIDSDPTGFVINLDPGYSVDWIDADRRLPSADANPQTGYNQTSSEMGHLWYTELDFNEGDTPTAEELNASNFDWLFNSFFWTSTAGTAGTAWEFHMANGSQYCPADYTSHYGLAVRSGQVLEIPVPGAIWLLGSGSVVLIEPWANKGK